jgi:hypothetical protein
MVSYTKAAKKQQIPKPKRKTELICQIINGNKSNRGLRSWQCCLFRCTREWITHHLNPQTIKSTEKIIIFLKN